MNWQRKLAACLISLLLGGWGSETLGLAAGQSVVAGAASGSVPRASQAAPTVAYTGYFGIIWGDGPAGSGRMAETYWLNDGAGLHLRLELAPDLAQPWGGPLALNGRRVIMTGTRLAVSAQGDEADVLQVLSLEPAVGLGAAELGAQALTGSQPWVSILCKFPDQPEFGKDLAYFQAMYDNAYPRLDHYWREVSYNNINVAGSGASGAYTLPQPRSYYLPGGALNLDRVAADCTAAADDAVDFRPFVGINLMFNADLDGYAWGGSEGLTLDGVYRSWRMTWEPPWGWSSVAVLEHEMGHGFGLPHSSGMYGATYDSYWDVMSNSWVDPAYDPTYGAKGQHTIAPYKDRLGWIPATQKYTFPSRWTATLTLERLALPQTGNYQYIRIPTCSSSVLYSVEARRKVGYDSILPGEGIIIHKVQSGLANVVDTNPQDIQAKSTRHANFSPGGAYTNAPDGFSVTINSATATGYVVTISANAPCALPEPPVLVAPANGALRNRAQTGFFWQPSTVPGQTQFSLLLSASPSAEVQPWLLNNDRFGTSTQAITYTFSADGTYAWFMRAWNAKGMSSGWVSRTVTIDTVAPSSAVGNLPANSPGVFNVSWGGTDATSGIGSYDVQYRVDSGPWLAWQTNTTLTRATLVGLKNHTYGFRCRATDRAGNAETWPTLADTTTTVISDPVIVYLPAVVGP